MSRFARCVRLLLASVCGLTFTLAYTTAARAQAAKDDKPAPSQRPCLRRSGRASRKRGPARFPRERPNSSRRKLSSAIEEGLRWLSKQQSADGSYGGGAYRGNIAVTSLAALAMMSSGSSPGRGPYGSQIDRALQYVIDNTSPSGFISVPNASTHGPMYSHGFGTLFLAEAYGMTRRPEIREKLEKAVKLIIDTQNGEGGWRYQPVRARCRPFGHHLPNQRTAGSAKRGIFVPKETVDGVHSLCEAKSKPRWRFSIHDLQWGERVSTLGGGRGGALLGGRLRHEGGGPRDRVLEEVHAGDSLGPAVQPLFLRTLLRGAGNVDPRRRRLEPVVSRHPRRAGFQALRAGILE